MIRNKGTVCLVDGCEGAAHCRGWCRTHYKRWMRHGDPITTLIAPKGSRMTHLLRLLDIATDECLLWPYTPTSGGYGAVNIDNQAVGAHVTVCQIVHGPRPAGMEAAHSCGIRRCVNPRHLRWATHTENLADMVRHGTRLRGDTHPRSKIAEADRAVILARWFAGESLSSLSREWGIERGSIRGWAKRDVDVS